METISFYSYKGGVGRTLLVANVAHFLAQFGFRVFLMDLDLEAPGLHAKLKSLWHDKSGFNNVNKKGFIDYLYLSLNEKKIPENLHDFVFDDEETYKKNGGSLHLMSAGNAPYPDYVNSLFKIDFYTLFHGTSDYCKNCEEKPYHRT